jgi:16S rRNA C967 or C1407 C5-methylase (RsmB/RsmF family)/NOL1/NOP2/fmu family ribosome biogenesis protein
MQLPKDFESYTRRLFGADRWQRFEQGLDGEPPVSVRLNPLKVDAASVSLEGDDGLVPWCALGHYLSSRPAFTFDPLLHAGTYYVQEASSMFLHWVLRQLVRRPVVLLDLCAAPGGKTMAAQCALPEGSVVMSNEPIVLRSNILAENLAKFGSPHSIVTRNYAADYARAGLRFDVVVADVPCSGEGMFRKDPGAIAEWSQDHVNQCQELQRSIVEDIWPCLRPGGLLIYSTCTFNTLEDEDNVAWIASHLDADFVPLEVHASWQITGPLTGQAPVFRFLPGITRGEGFFLCVLRKRGESNDVMAALAESADKKGRARRRGKAAGKEQPTAGPGAQAQEKASWLEGYYNLRQAGQRWRAVPKQWTALYDAAASHLNILQAGVTLGTERGRDLVPDASLALSKALRKDACQRVEVDYPSAVSYLRKEAVTLPADTPKGLVLLCYRGHALGWEKNMGNRANNLYPAEWRIKSTHLPEAPADIIRRS